jgi:hypothetical protein
VSGEKPDGRPWVTCHTPGCAAFGRKVYSGADCLACDRPLPWPHIEVDAEIDLRLLNRALERAKGEVKRIEDRIAMLSVSSGR